jgi:hypothetical protein
MSPERFVKDLRAGPRVYGAGDGNRTHVRSLGSFYTAIVRRPLDILDSTRKFYLNTTAGALDIPINLRRWLALACVRAPPAGVVCLHSTFQFHGVS